MVVPIVLYGSSFLRKHSKDITEEDKIMEISDKLFQTLKNAEGIGLAGPQIKILKRAFVIDTSPLIENDLSIEKFEGIFINPAIIDFSTDLVTFTEGCLSLPGIYEDLSRPEKILVRYQNISFNTIEEELVGIKSRIFQHEFDHLQGILFIDKISLIRRKLLSGKLNKIGRKAISKN